MSIQSRRPEVRYTDFKINFDPHPVRKDLVLDVNEDAVKRSIKNLLFTDYYERFFNPSLGAGLKAYLFENIDSFTALAIKERIIQTINTYEKRALLNEVLVIAEPDSNSYSAKIVFTTINNPTPIIIDALLTRVR